MSEGPSPSGRRWREAPDEGGHTGKFPHSNPHPPLRGTLSRRERDLFLCLCAFVSPSQCTLNDLGERADESRIAIQGGHSPEVSHTGFRCDFLIENIQLI